MRRTMGCSVGERAFSSNWLTVRACSWMKRMFLAFLAATEKAGAVPTQKDIRVAQVSVGLRADYAATLATNVARRPIPTTTKIVELRPRAVRSSLPTPCYRARCRRSASSTSLMSPGGMLPTLVPTWSIDTERTCSACVFESRLRPDSWTGSKTWNGCTRSTLEVTGTTVTTPRPSRAATVSRRARRVARSLNVLPPPAQRKMGLRPPQ